MGRFETAELKLAFAYHLAQSIVGADSHVLAEETAYLDATFPVGLLTHVGFVDARGQFTDKFAQARTDALSELPDLLSQDEKLGLISLFVEACLADGHLDRTESQVLVQAAHQLGLGWSDVDAHLGGLDAVGEVELDDPLDEQGDA